MREVGGAPSSVPLIDMHTRCLLSVGEGFTPGIYSVFKIYSQNNKGMAAPRLSQLGMLTPVSRKALTIRWYRLVACVVQAESKK